MIQGLFFLLFGLAALFITIWLFILLPAKMAEARGRSAFAWVLVSIFFSPIVAIFLLWALGDAPNRND